MSSYREPDKEALEEKATRERAEEDEIRRFARAVGRPKGLARPESRAAKIELALKIVGIGIAVVFFGFVAVVGLILFTCSVR